MILFLSLIALPVTAADKPQILRAGAALSNLTPPLGGGIIGGFHPIPSTHIHDELHARCLALDNGETRLAIVVCDLLGASREVYDAARRLVTEETGLPGANLFMSSTHTHSATSALGTNRFRIHTPLDEYQQFVARRIADGVRRAMNNLAPARIGWATGQEPNHVFNRRWFLKPGTMPVNPFGSTNDLVKMNPGRASPSLDRPSGPTDPEICLVSVQSPQGRPIAVLANYSLHYVGGMGGGQISADYFGEFARLMPSRLRGDENFVAMMSNGTSGDINNIPFGVTRPPRAPFEQIRIVAQKAADTAWFAQQKIGTHRNEARLGMRQREVTLRYRRPGAQDIVEAKTVLAVKDQKAIERLPRLAQNYAGTVVRAAERNEETITIIIQAIRIGDLAVCGIPFETFVEIGLDLKKRSPFPQTMVIGLANGRHGYLPTPEQHKLGGYETWLGTNWVQEDASVILVNHLLEMLTELKP